MDAHTAASVPGALPSSYISGLEARYFLPSSVSWRLLGHLHTSEDTSEYSHWKRQKSYLKKKIKRPYRSISEIIFQEMRGIRNTHFLKYLNFT